MRENTPPNNGQALNREQIEADLWLAKLSRAAPREERILFPLVKSLFKDLDGKIGLDLGCGDGWSTTLLTQASLKEIVGVDVNSVLIERANERYSQEARATFRQGDASKLDWIASESVDIILSKGMFQHLNDDKAEQAIAEVARVLRIGGEFCLIVVHPIWNILFTQVQEEGVITRFSSYIGSSKILLSDPSDPYCGERYRRSISWYSLMLGKYGLLHQVFEVKNDGHPADERHGCPLFLIYYGRLT